MRKSAGKGSIHNKGAKMSFTAVFLKVPEGYIGFVEELPGANTQGKTLAEVRKNLREAVKLVLGFYSPKASGDERFFGSKDMP